MEVLYTLLLLKVVLFKWSIQNGLSHSSDDPNRNLNEYCEGESFKAECRTDEAIIIQQALYGRMSIGKCIDKGYGEMNCKADVRDKLDYMCSGKQHCDVRVASIYELLSSSGVNPCSTQLRSYLSASYACVQVINPNVAECGTRPDVITQPNGYISNLMTQQTNCGSFDKPWTVRLNQGLKMKITLYDFAYSKRFANEYGSDKPNTCQVYAVIKEQVGNTNNAISKTVCGNNMRDRVVFVSNSNEVEIRVVKRENTEIKEYFLLKYEAFGCQLPAQPRYGWVRMYNEKATFGCNASDTTWSWICTENSWLGDNKTCPVVDGAVRVGGAAQENGSFGGLLSGSQWAALIIIGCIALTIGLVIFMIGLFYIRRKRTSMERRSVATGSYQRPSLPDFYAQTQPIDPQVQSNYTTRKSYPGQEGYGPPFTNDYMRTWQMQRHHNSRNEPQMTVPQQVTEPTVQSQIDGRPMSEHIYESPNFDRKFKAIDGFAPIFGNKHYLDGDGGKSNRGSDVSSSHHTA